MFAEKGKTVTESEQIAWIAWQMTEDTSLDYYAGLKYGFSAAASKDGVALKIYNDDNKDKPAVFAQLQSDNCQAMSTLRYKTDSLSAGGVTVVRQTLQDCKAGALADTVGYLALWGTSIKKTSEKNPCEGLMWYIQECTELSGWHAATNYDKFKDGSACTVLVLTRGSTCKSFCNSQGRDCLYGQDNEGSGCKLNDAHDRQSTSENGCLQRWNNQVCACGAAKAASSSRRMLLEVLQMEEADYAQERIQALNREVTRRMAVVKKRYIDLQRSKKMCLESAYKHMSGLFCASCDPNWKRWLTKAKDGSYQMDMDKGVCKTLTG